MKFLRGLFICFGVLSLAAILVFGISLYLSPTATPGATEETTGAISPEMIEQAQELAERIGRRLAWVMVLVSAVMQAGAWIAAGIKLRSVRKSGESATKQLLLLDAIDIYFDLPLYFGLLGSVGSFILITFFPDAGLMFAYASTAMGIIVSVILRLGYHTPFKQELLQSADVPTT